MAALTLAPNNTWFSQGGTTIKRENITQINIVDSYTTTGNETASWDASADKDGSVMCHVTGTVLTIAGNGAGKVYANADSKSVFHGFTKMTSFNGAAVLDTSNATTLERAFYDCGSLTALDLSSWNTGNVQSLLATFNGMLKLNSLNVKDWSTGNVTNMQGTFQCDVALTELDLSGWATNKVTTFASMFEGLDSYGGPMKLKHIIGLDDWDTSSCTTMYRMFSRCTALESLDVADWDVSKVQTFEGMFNMSNGGTVQSQLTALDVSGWETSSCTNMSLMFYGLNGVGTLDVSKFDVSKVTTFDHMMAHSYVTLVGVENWEVSSACTNMNAMFHTVRNTSLDVSKFDTSKVTSFGQMFQNANNLAEIIGLENFDTSNAYDFAEMFQGCSSLKELDLSGFDTRKAKDGEPSSANGTLSATMQYMFQYMYRLEKLTLGPNFSFKGDGTTTDTSHYAVLPTPNATYTPGATGHWYTQYFVAYAPSDVPSNIADTYYASLALAKRPDYVESVYLIKKSTLLALADAVRHRTGLTEKMTLNEMIVELTKNIPING